MKIIYNNIIPFKGFKAINLFGVIFARKGVIIDERTIRHERIHTAQMRELLFVFFYLFYVIEYLIRIPLNDFDTHKAYRSISFEREAFENDYDLNYLRQRKLYSFINYFKN